MEDVRSFYTSICMPLVAVKLPQVPLLNEFLAIMGPRGAVVSVGLATEVLDWHVDPG